MRSNLSVTRQAIFGFAGRIRTQASSAVQRFREIMNEPPSKPYKLRTPEEKMAFDLSFFEEDDFLRRRRKR